MRVSRSFLFILFISVVAVGCSSEKKVSKNQRYLDQTFTLLKKNLTGAEVTIKNDTVKVLFPSNIMFDFNAAVIKPESMPDLQHFADVLNEYKKTEILINGHTDSVGGDSENNLVLSKRRADTAFNVLAFYKVNPSRMHTWGHGAREPLVSNETEEGRKRNRRVEFIILLNYKKEKS